MRWVLAMQAILWRLLAICSLIPLFLCCYLLFLYTSSGAEWISSRQRLRQTTASITWWRMALMRRKSAVSSPPLGRPGEGGCSPWSWPHAPRGCVPGEGLRALLLSLWCRGAYFEFRWQAVSIHTNFLGECRKTLASKHPGERNLGTDPLLRHARVC